MKYITILLLLCWIPFSRQYAQSNDYVFSHLDFSGGLSNNRVTCTYKDQQGYMWFGTVSGLNRYDGYQIKTYRHSSQDSSSIIDNYIEQIFEGPGGKLWVECRAGRFNIYDFKSEKFDRDYLAYTRSLHLPQYSWLKTILHGKDDYWFIYQDSGIYHMQSDGSIVSLRPIGIGTHSIYPSVIRDARLDGQGNCWLVHQNGLLEKIDGKGNTVSKVSDALGKVLGDSISFCKFFIDKDNDCWFYSNGVFTGAWYYAVSTGKLLHLKQGSGPGDLSGNVIYDILQDGKDKIWLATDHGGVDILDKKTFSVTVINHIEDDGKSLADNSIGNMLLDYTGTIWLGTFKSGLSYYHQNRMQFRQYRHQPSNKASLSYDDINAFAEDASGNFWMGANGGGLIYFDRKNNSFRQYPHDPAQPNSLSNNIIVHLLMDKSNKLWIGTYFGGLDCFDGKTFTHYRHDEKQPQSLSDDRVMCVYEDSGNQIWVGTLAGGMDRLDKEKHIFYHYKDGPPNSIRNNYVSSITEDVDHNLWVGTGYGIDVLEKSTERFIHYSNDGNKLGSDNVISLLRDSRGFMWAGTREGLSLFDPAKKQFRNFTTDNGLPDNTVRSIVEDANHNIWISTPNGLSRLTANWSSPPGDLRIKCRNFHEADGLQGREFNEKAGYAARDGNLLFGGSNGLNIFKPSSIVDQRNEFPIVLTDLQLFNKSIRPGEKVNNHVILPASLSDVNEITLRHGENVFSIEFASLDFVEHARNKYAYKLDGFDKNWLVSDGKTRKATYTNLDAGDYTFHVKASDEDGDWLDKEAILKIRVLPPFWKTSWAYTLYFLAVIALLYLARRMVIRRARMRFSLEQERKEARRMHEMDMMKIRFFTNMSHELRTPLSLILAPLERLLGRPSNPELGKQYELIRRNAMRLLHLVNQLLDFRKMETNELKLHPKEGDIVKFVRDVSMSFTDLAEKKHIDFSYRCTPSQFFTTFDYDKLERILFNLLSNAFKFTPEYGVIQVTLSVTQSGGEEKQLRITVKDTGIGISREHQTRIFERFFQTEVPNNILNQGSGIGLAISMEFVKMHRGTLTVESEPNNGSTFTIQLPLREITKPNLPLLLSGNDDEFTDQLVVPPSGKLSIAESPAAEHPPLPFTPASSAASNGSGASSDPASDQGLNGTTPQASSDPSDATSGATGKAITARDSATPPSAGDQHPGDINTAGSKKKIILLIEDNEDFRFYLKDNLREKYIIHEAGDGQEGWRKALALHPDLVVSDISMPLMDGIELCRKIRADERTRQLPVILLTALAEESVELKSMRIGANDYIAKPFNFEILQSRIRSLLDYSETIKKTYQRQVEASPTAVQPLSADDIFLQDVLSLIEKNMANADFSVEEMTQHFHTSRSTFYKRLLLVTGKTPVEFIRQMRLKRGAELLEKSQMTVSEIAYAVGFNNPKYFTQQFKLEFDTSPSQYRSEKRQNA